MTGREFRVWMAAALALPLCALAAPAATQDNAAQWHAPLCAVIQGTTQISFTASDGARLARASERPSSIAYANGMIATHTADRLLAVVNSALIESRDAGCHWQTLVDLGPQTGNAILRLTAAPADRAYAWAENANLLFRIDGTQVTPLPVPDIGIVAVGTHATDSARVELVDSRGAVWRSADSGTGGFTRVAAGPGGDDDELFQAYRAAIDPIHFDHIVVGTAQQGAFVSRDGGLHWARSSGLGNQSNVFRLEFAPSEKAGGRIVWAMGLNITELDAGAASGGRHLYRSNDGGDSFTPVVDQSANVTLLSGPVMAPAPDDDGVVYFQFGTSFAGYGTDLYRYDAATGVVTKTHNKHDGIGSIVFHPRWPRLLYLGLITEQP